MSCRAVLRTNLKLYIRIVLEIVFTLAPLAQEVLISVKLVWSLELKASFPEPIYLDQMDLRIMTFENFK